MLAGVTLELRDGVTGQPILGSAALAGYYAADQPITTTTDAGGHYAFLGLPPGTYAVYDIQPAGYLAGIDTPGSAGGALDSQLIVTDATAVQQLVALPQYDAILGITLTNNGSSVMNNFSVVTTTVAPPSVQVFVFPVQPAAAAAVVATPYQAQGVNPTATSFVLNPLLMMPVVPVTGADLYTWHLSVVDAGQPRATQLGAPLVQFTAMRPDGDESGWDDEPQDTGEWTLTMNGRATGRRRFGIRGGTPIAGDFNGDGKSEVGVFKDGRWFIDLNDNGVWDKGDLWARLGHKGDLPVTGDWDGDGKTDIGIYGPAWPGDPRAIAHEPGLPDPDNENTGAQKNIPREPRQSTLGDRRMRLTSGGRPRADLIDHVFLYGAQGDRPLVGDWNGDGVDTIAVFRDGVWHRDTDGDGKLSKADTHTHFGKSGDIPVVGDFNGDGIDELGVYRNGTWTIDTNGNGMIDGEDRVFRLGAVGDKPIVGDWDGDGRADPGVYHDRPTPPEGRR